MPLNRARVTTRGPSSLRDPLTEVITVAEAAERLGVSQATVKRYCAAGKLKARKAGRTWLIDTGWIKK